MVDLPEMLAYMARSRATKLMLDAPSPPTFFYGERLLSPKEFQTGLTAEECRRLIESALSKEERAELAGASSILLSYNGSGAQTYKMLVTSKDGYTSAVITAAS